MVRVVEWGSVRRFYHDVKYGGRMMLTLMLTMTQIDRGGQSNKQAKEVGYNKDGHEDDTRGNKASNEIGWVVYFEA